MAGGSRSVANFIIRFGFFGLIIIVLISVLYSIKVLFTPFLVAVLLTFLLQPVINFLENRSVSRLSAVIGIYVFFVLAFIITSVIIVPLLLAEAHNLTANLPVYEKTIENVCIKFRTLILTQFPKADVPDFYLLLKSKILQNSNHIVGLIPALASNLFSWLSVLVIIPIMTFFFLVDGHLIQKTLLQLVPNRYFEMFILLFHKVVSSIELFIRGQLIDSLAVGIMTCIGLAIIGMPYNIVIGIIAGLGNVIPYLGPLIGFLPALFVLIVSPAGFTLFGLIKLVIVFAAVQFLEGTFVYPIAVGKSVNLHPLVVIVGITIGGQLGGVIGMLIAIPIIAIAKVALEVLYFYLKQYSII
jgi:predicted PurR-regulated permease PerM